jgi:hypothetical protein
MQSNQDPPLRREQTRPRCRRPGPGRRAGTSFQPPPGKRAPYTRPFRGFLEPLGENPREFDHFRRGFWDDFEPDGGFEVGDLVENRRQLRRPKRTRQAKLVEIRRRAGRRRREGMKGNGESVCEAFDDYSHGIMEKIKRGIQLPFSPTLVPSPCCKQSGYLNGGPFGGVFGGTKSCQILPILTKNAQRKGANRADNGGFSRLILLKRVKCRGPCQAFIGSGRRESPALPEGKEEGRAFAESHGGHREEALGRRIRR